MQVLGVMPVKGRIQQTIECITRLLNTADYVLHIVVVTDGDSEAEQEIERYIAGWQGYVSLIPLAERGGYWNAMSIGAKSKPEYSHILNLANDLKGTRQWLSRAVAAYENHFGNEPAIMGLNDGVHPGTHAGHFIASRVLLESWYGEDLYPFKYYVHLYGDNEIVERAHALNRFGIAPWAVLLHDHPANGASSDEIYALGHASLDVDWRMYEKRKKLWKR